MTPFANPEEWFRNELRNFFRDAGRRSGSGSRRRSRRGGSAGAFPPVNIYDDGEAFRVRAELPGVSKEDLEINAKADEIVIRGAREVEPPEEGANWHRRERQGGKFRRTVNLPEPVDTDEVTASLKLGVLDIYAPRAHRPEARQIEVE